MNLLVLGWLLFRPAAVETLDLETGTRLAAERSNAATIAALTERRQQIDLDQARTAWAPDLSFGLGGQASMGRTFSEQLGVNVNEPNTSLYSSLTTSTSLYQGGALRAERAQAEAELAASQASREQTLHDLRWWVADGLLEIEQARATVTVQEAALEADEALLAQVEILVLAGARTKADQHAQLAVVSSRRAAVASAAQALREAELTLLNMVRLDPEDDWTFVAPPLLEEPGAAQSLIATGTSQRPELRASQDLIEASEAGARSARSAYLPSVSLGAGASSSWLSSNPAPVLDQLDSQSRTWASVDLSLRLFDRGVRRASVETAGVALREAELDRQGLTDELALDVRRLLTQEEAARSYLEASATAAESAQQAVDVLNLRYQAGAETLVSLTQARATLVNAELERTWADSAVQRIRYQLAWTTGELGAG